MRVSKFMNEQIVAAPGGHRVAQSQPIRRFRRRWATGEWLDRLAGADG